MRKTRIVVNSFGGYDSFYSICCDICGEFLKNEVKRDKDFGQPVEFRSCGEEWLKALGAGWIGDQDTIICPKCLHSIGD